MVSERLHGVTGRAVLGDENLLKDLPAKMRRAARAREDWVNHEYQRATRDFFELMGVGQRRAIRWPETAVRARESTGMSSKTEHAPEWRMEYEDHFPWTGGPPCRWLTSLERTDRSGHGRARQELDGCALLHPTGAEESVTSAWRVCTSAHLHAFREAEGAGASTPLVRDPGELLSRTYSGSSTRVDNWRRLELNTQDSDEDVLFRQEMRYPEIGGGGFSNLRRVGAGENRDSPPAQLLEEYQTASWSQYRKHQEDRYSAGREEIGEGADHEEPEPAGREREERGPPASASHHFGSSRPWADAAVATRPPMPLRHSASAPLPPRHDKSMQQPRQGR